MEIYKRTLYLLLVLLFYNAQAIVCQNLTIDQLELQYEKAVAEKDYDKALIALNKLGDVLIYHEMKHQDGYSLLKSFVPYLADCTQDKERAKFYVTYAEAATYAQDYRGSVRILKEGIQFLEQLQDSSLYEYGYAYLKAGENTNKLNRFTESATYFQKAEKLFAHQQDTLMLLWTKSGLSTLFSSYAIYDKAAEEREFIFQTQPQDKYGQVVAIAHLRAASDDFFQNLPEKELYHIEQALQVKDNHSDIQGIVRLLTLCYATTVYAKHQQKEKANYYFKELHKRLGDKSPKTPFLASYYSFAQSRHALVNKRFKEAERYAKELLDNIKKTDDWQSLIRAYWLLANIYEETQQTPKALYYFKQYAHVKDSVSEAASRKKFAYVQTQFETEKKDLEIQQQNQAIELLQAENRIVHQRFLLGGLIVVGLFVSIYFWRQRLFSIRKGKLQKEFAKNLIRHLEDERKRIARELHDSIGQNLLLIKNSLLANPQSNPALIDQSIQEVRSMSQSLHPFQFEQLGLLTSIRHTVENFQKNSAIFYTEDIQVEHLEVEKEKEIFIYRMLQEGLANVEKHSQAKACQLQVKETPTQFIFSIKDNGKGFDVAEKAYTLNSLGLKNLKERAQLIGAELKIESKKGKGTLITIIISKKKY